MKKGIIILGSSNSNGATQKVASFVSEKTDYPIIDLKTKTIGAFDYAFNNRNDDFLPLIKHIVDNYQIIVFATPVYWYTMSGIMKTFFDRLSDCLKTEKDTGRKLRGMEMAVISCGCDKKLKDGFYMPFIETARYMGMTYMTDIYCVEENGLPTFDEIKFDNFFKIIKDGSSTVS